MRKSGLALSAVLALAIGGWSAPASAQQKQPPASAIALAQQLLEAKKANAFYRDSSADMVDRVKAALFQNNLNYQKDLNEVAEKVKQDVRNRENEIGAEMARAYATDFTEDELKGLMAYYKSPLGKKMLEQEPKTMSVVFQFVQDWTQRFGEELKGRFYEEMKKRGKPIM
jgi:hypothetical protein